MRTKHFTLLTVVFLLLPFTAAAQNGDPAAEIVPAVDCSSELCRQAAQAFQQQNYREAGELYSQYFQSLREAGQPDGAWLVHAAFAHQRAQSWNAAIRYYGAAARELPELQSFLLTEAVRSALHSSSEEDHRPLFEEAYQSNALLPVFRNGAFLKAQLELRLHGFPSPETIAVALRTAEKEELCPWVANAILANKDNGEQVNTAALAEVFQLAYGGCIDADSSALLRGFGISPGGPARLARAHQYFFAVDFPKALAELDRIEAQSLSAVESCQAQFRRARSHFRLRQWDVAKGIYRQIAENCTDEANEDERVRSLYAVGNRLYHLAANNRNQRLARLDEAQRFFTTLLNDYPHRSHADDALFFLARIERLRPQPDREKELKLLRRALTDYPHEDMVHEMAWEVYEPLFRSGRYQEFIDGVTTLPLPDWDREYFSQGRLEYFVGAAHARLGRVSEAARYWQLAWVKYPFGFYGYLGHLRLLENNHTPEPLLEGDDLRRVDWFQGDFLGGGADLLARAGHFDGACDVESARHANGGVSDRDKWRLATLCHHAGRYTQSHNIARRQIPGRPWSLPEAGRLIRWHVAWPDPYGAQLQNAVNEFGPSEEALYVHPGFASAIMREESGFAEEVVSWAGAVGLMQLMVATARDHDSVIEGRATRENLKQAENNIPIGIDHLARLSRRFNGHPVKMAAAYNAGSGRVDSWLRRQPTDEIALWVEDIPFLETRNYTKRVIGSYAAYQLLQGAERLDSRIAEPAR